MAFNPFDNFGLFKEGGLLNKKPIRNPYGTLNPEQQSLTQALGPYFQDQLNKGPGTGYTGTLSENISPEELNAIGGYNRLSALRGDSLANILKYDPQAFNEEFNTQVQQPTIDFFKREIQPLIGDNLSAFGTQRANVLGRNLSTLTENLAKQRFDAQQQRRNQVLDASGALNSAGASDYGINAVPREIRQAGLDRQYADYVRGSQQKQDSVNQMLQFLGISTVTEREDPTLERLLAILKTGGQLASLGAGGMGGVGAAAKSQSDILGFDTSNYR